jgi:hypothetical protein
MLRIISMTFVPAEVVALSVADRTAAAEVVLPMTPTECG